MKTLVSNLKIETDIDDRQVVRVRRSHLWEDSLRAFRKESMDTSKLLNVHFIGEEAADEGGPRREYLQLLLNSIVNKAGILEGSEKRRIFTLNPLLLTSQVYYQAGRMTALAIQQEGPGLKCLSPVIYYMMLGIPDHAEITPDDVPDLEMRARIKKVSEIFVRKAHIQYMSQAMHTVYTSTYFSTKDSWKIFMNHCLLFLKDANPLKRILRSLMNVDVCKALVL